MHSTSYCLLDISSRTSHYIPGTAKRYSGHPCKSRQEEICSVELFLQFWLNIEKVMLNWLGKENQKLCRCGSSLYDCKGFIKKSVKHSWDARARLIVHIFKKRLMNGADGGLAWSQEEMWNLQKEQVPGSLHLQVPSFTYLLFAWRSR